MWMIIPEGGGDWPTSFVPQQTTASSDRTAHVCWLPADTFIDADRGAELLPSGGQPPAVRTLKVREHDDGDQGLRIALGLPRVGNTYSFHIIVSHRRAWDGTVIEAGWRCWRERGGTRSRRNRWRHDLPRRESGVLHAGQEGDLNCEK
jgi:hypothetical protein